MRTFLVTGGAGFIGSHLAIAIQQHCADVRVVALDSLKRRGAELNLPRLRAAGVAFVHGDVRNAEDLDAVGPVELIVECSAEPSVLAGFGTSPQFVLQANLAGAIHCFELARRHGAATIFLSSSRVYPYAALNGLAYREEASRFALEEHQTLPGASAQGIAESFPLEGPRSLYGATKLCAELLLQEYREMYGLRGIVNRCGVVSGPWQMGKVDQGFVVLWAARHLYGGPLQYIGFGGAGKQVRDVLHVDDLIRLVLYQLDHIEDLNGQVFNVGGGRASSVSLCELTAFCREAVGKAIAVDGDAENRPADLRLYVTDNAHVTHTTGWRPEKDVATVVQDVCAWIADHREALRPIIG